MGEGAAGKVGQRAALQAKGHPVTGQSQMPAPPPQGHVSHMDLGGVESPAPADTSVHISMHGCIAQCVYIAEIFQKPGNMGISYEIS